MGWTRASEPDILAPMSSTPLALKNGLFWLVFIVWLATAIPVVLFSLFTLELPLWPSFSEESTAEGISVWAVVTAWFYITPVTLLVIRRRKRRTSAL